MKPERDRLRRLQAENDAKGAAMHDERGRSEALRRESAKPRAVSAFNLFQTPPKLALQMAKRLRDLLHPFERRGDILEPSAGLGRLVRACASVLPEARVTMIENNADCCYELYHSCAGARLLQRDFLEWTPKIGDAGPDAFRGVIMNPPFRRGLDIKHILHAWELIDYRGGALVALCYDGVKQREKLQSWADTWDPLPAGSFKSEGTKAGVVLITKSKRG